MTVETGAVTLLSDAQVGAVIAALSALGASGAMFIRAMFGRVLKSMDDSSAERAAHRAELTTLVVKVDAVHGAVQGWILDDAANRPARAATPAQGLPYHRPATHGR